MGNTTCLQKVLSCSNSTAFTYGGVCRVFVSWSYVRARCGLVSHLGRCCLLTASPLFSLLTVTLLSFCQFLISFAVTFQRFCRFFISSTMCDVSHFFFSFMCNCKTLLFYFWTNSIDFIFAFLSYIFFETFNKPLKTKKQISNQYYLSKNKTAESCSYT